MALSKRQRIPSSTKPNKRPKYIEPDTESSSSSSSNSEEEEIADQSTIEWEAERIVEQRGKGFGLDYLIEWKGIDPATGQPWEPTWERAIKANASEKLLADWKKEQAVRAREKKSAPPKTTGSAQRREPPEAPPAQATQTRVARHRHTVESPELSELAPVTALTVDTSQRAATPSTATADIGASSHNWASPQINIDLRGDSFHRNEYEIHTEIPESPNSLPRSTAEDTELESSQLFASQAAFRGAGIVADTQSTAGDISYIPVTQEDLESSLRSNDTNETTEEQVVGISGLLDADAAPRLGARSQSPATSIAETIADTTQDLQSQRQRESQQEQSEIPETIESPATAKSDSRAAQNKSVSVDQSSPVWAHSQIRENQHEAQSPEELVYVENITQFDHDTSQRNFPRLAPYGSEQSALPRERRGPVEHNSQPAASVAASEGPVVADTPQISQVSQLASTFQDSTTHKEQTGPTKPLGLSQLSAEFELELCLTERSIFEDNAQFPFHSQYPACFDPRSAAKAAQRAVTEPLRPHLTREVPSARLSQDLTASADYGTTTIYESVENTTIDEISQPSEQPEQRTSPQRSSAAQESLAQPDNGEEVAAVEGSEAIVPTVNFIEALQAPPSSKESTDLQEHNAQIVPSSAYLSTQDVTGSILATIEVDPAEASSSKNGSPCSRHDSSQETPERQSQSVKHSSSPIPHPPSYSLRTVDSNVPPRPATPVLTSSLFKMADSEFESTAAKVERELKERLAANRAANPYTPRKRIRASQPSSIASAGAAAVASPLQTDKTPVLPIINVLAEGTRSPSTVPDRSPAPPAQTSLRTVAIANAKEKAKESLLENPLAATSTSTDAGPSKEKADHVAAVAAENTTSREPNTPPKVLADEDNEVMSDVELNAADDDDGSVYNDDLHLENEEYVVPLFIEGRQRDTYIEYIKQKGDLFDAIVPADEAPATKLDEVEQVLAHLKAIESHPDLTYAEAESATPFELRSTTDVQHGAQFGIDNSVKFKFLQDLFNRLRNKDLHVILLLDQDKDALLNILRTFFAAGAYNYNMPTKGYRSNTSDDALTITTFPSSTSPILRPADLIICLDGVQSAAEIRQKNWAVASGRVVPVLHLVVPQTVGHVVRYLLPNAERWLRIETVVVALGQIHEKNEIGNAIDIDTPDASEAAQLIASWLFPIEDEESTEWPLPSIGSARSFVEFEATQQSVRSAPSSPDPERTKRPLETDDSDTAKRMRYTPQPRVIPNSSVNPDHEVTRVSDSMPGTAATETAHLLASLDRKNAELIRVLEEHRDERVMWDRQQTEHESRQQDYRKLFNEKAEVDRAHESMTRNRDKLRTQLETQATDLRALREELQAQRDLSLASTDGKDVEITRLRQELEAARIERDKALASVNSTDKTLDFIKDQYRLAQNTAAQLQSDLTALETQNVQLTIQASGEQAKLKALHLETSHKNLMQQCKLLSNENAQLKATLRQKEEDLIRAKNNSGRSVYGTRAASTTPQPKTRSRAASPTGRVPRGGRVSNIMAEER